jgi:hypothetical protein
MVRLLLVIVLALSLASAHACEKRQFKYRKGVPEKYAEAALLEYGAGSVTSNTKPTVLAGSTCSGAKVVTVLYPSPQGTHYVALVMNNNNQLEVKSRGMTKESPMQISSRFSVEAFLLPDIPPE